jgi:peptide/nickel transport system substrate-binding protein
MKRPTLLIAGALALAVGAGQALAQAPKRGGDLRFAVSAEPPNYDCHANTSFAFIHPIRPHYNTLLRFKRDKYPDVEGDLAESWTVAPDGLTYTFKLRKGVKFHDGTAFTAEDVKATYDRIRDPAPGVRSIRKGAYSDIDSIQTPDAHTVVVKMKRRNAAMLALFASPWDCIYSAAKLKQDPKFPERNIMGTGPFTFVEHVAGSHWVGKRFDGYFKKGQPYLDSYRALFIKGAPMVNALSAGEILVEFRGHTPPDVDRLTKALGDRAVVHESPWVVTLVVSFNTTKKPFDDERVRKALSLAIDRWGGAAALSRVTFVKPVGALLRPGFDLAATEADLVKLPGYGKDINAARAEARRLLKEAGAENLKFKLTNRNVANPYTPVGVFLIDQWRQIGVQVEHEQLETKQYLAKQQDGSFDAALDFQADFMDEPNLQLLKILSADRSPVNYSGYIDRKVDYLYDKQSGELDRKERYKVLRELEAHVLEKAFVIPTIWWNRVIVHHKQLKNWKMSPSHYLNQDLDDVWLDQ